MSASLGDIRAFLALRRIALVGTSRDPKDFSRYLFRELCNKGYDVVPVNPLAAQVDGRPCFPRVHDIHPAVEGALILTAARDTAQVVRDCAQAGIRHIWMHRSAGQGSVDPEAVDFCRQEGIHLVAGYCPFMFLPHTAFVHRLHGFMVKLTGAYPRNVERAA